MKYGIVVDSSCDLLVSDYQSDLFDFTIVPLKIVTADKEYIDDETTNTDDLLASMKLSEEASKTSCPSPHDFEEAYKKSEHVFCFTLSGELSGTYNSSRLAKDMMEQDYPNKKIAVFDTKSTAGNLIMMVEKTKELIEKELSFEQIQDELNEYMQTLKIFFTLGNYDNLVKTGRMSSMAKTIADSLNIKIICSAIEGKIEICKKVRGNNRLFKTMVEMMKEQKDLKNMPIYINACRADEKVELLVQLIKENLDTENIHVIECKALTTFYAMPGGVIVSF